MIKIETIHKVFGYLFMALAFISGIAFLIKCYVDFSYPTLAISIGSIVAGLGFVTIIKEVN